MSAKEIFTNQKAESRAKLSFVFTLQKQWSFPLRIFSVNVPKSTENCRLAQYPIPIAQHPIPLIPIPP